MTFTLHIRFENIHVVPFLPASHIFTARASPETISTRIFSVTNK